MGLSSSSSKSSTKPVYSSQLTGAANTVTSAYNRQAPKLSAITDQLGGLVPGLLERYRNGDANVNAAKGYNTDVLSGKYLDSNPYIDAIVDKSNNDVSNRLAASLGTRGLAGGSAFGDIISRAVSDNANTLRFNNYNTERGRMDTAAGMAPGLAAAGELPLASLLEIAQAQQMPVQAAAGYGSSIGGLLGAYTNQTQKSSPSLFSQLIGAASNAAGAYAAGR